MSEPYGQLPVHGGGTGQDVTGPHGSQPWEELSISQGIPTSNILGNAHAEFN